MANPNPKPPKRRKGLGRKPDGRDRKKSATFQRYKAEQALQAPGPVPAGVSIPSAGGSAASVADIGNGASKRRSTRADLSRKLGGLVRQNKRLKSDLEKQAAENEKKDAQIEKGNSLIKLRDTQIDNIIKKCEAISQKKIQSVRARSQRKLDQNNAQWTAEFDREKKRHEQEVDKLRRNVRRISNTLKERNATIQSLRDDQKLSRTMIHASRSETIAYEEQQEKRVVELERVQLNAVSKEKEAVRAQRQISSLTARLEAEERRKGELIGEYDSKLKEKDEQIVFEQQLAHDQKMKHQQEVDDVKIKHKGAMKELRVRHAVEMHKKTHYIKELKHSLDEFPALLKAMSDICEAADSAEVKANNAETLAAARQAKLKKVEEAKEQLKATLDREYIDNAELQEEVETYRKLLEDVTKDYDEELERLAPEHIKKRWVKNVGKKGGTMQWDHVTDELILELLFNRTPPSCIQANILAFARTILKNHDIVEAIPCKRYIQQSRGTLLHVTRTLAAFSLGKCERWIQIFYDDTSRRQVSITNVGVRIRDEDDRCKTICLDAGIISEDATSETQSNAVVASFVEGEKRLAEWRKTTEEMYPDRPDLLDQIPDPDAMSVVKLLGGSVGTDTCNGAQLSNKLTREKILRIAREKGVPEFKLVLYECLCHHHIRNVVCDKIVETGQDELTVLLRDDLEIVPSHLRVSTKIDSLLRAFDKECSSNAQYAKGHGAELNRWVADNHPGRGILPIIRMNGNRQDVVGDGCMALFSFRDILVAWLDFRLTCGNSDNILQRNLFIILESMEMIAIIRLLAIMHLTIVLPWRWIVAKTHTLGDQDWSERDMNRVYDLFYAAMAQVVADGSKWLDQEFMMSIFDEVVDELPEFEQYLEDFYNSKSNLAAGSKKKDDAKTVVKEVIAELFYPTRKEVIETHDMCCTLAEKMAARAMLELTNPNKAASKFVSAADGIHSVNNVSDAEREAMKNHKANTSDSESIHAMLTSFLEGGGKVNLDYAAGQGQSRFNDDFGRKDELAELVSGRRSKKTEEEGEGATSGTYHTLPDELKRSLIATAKKFAKRNRKRYHDALARQLESKQRKEKLAYDKKMELLKDDWIGASYLHLQGHSNRIWDTEEKAEREYNRLKTEGAKLRAVREQILIRYVGFGWAAAHHPWSSEGRSYNSAYLLRFLVDVVIPLAKSESVPSSPPMSLPNRPTLATLGTQAGDVKDRDAKRTTNNFALRTKWIEEREALESEGKGDALMEIQRSTEPDFDDENLAGFKLDMLFSYDNGVLEWCQGVVIKVVSKKRRSVRVRWNQDCLRDGDAEVSTACLLPSKWNPNVHANGAWRENLREELEILLEAESSPT